MQSCSARSIAAAAIAVALALAIPLQGFAQGGAKPEVRLSKSGICHNAGSQHYARLKDFRTFSSMKECVDAGGRPTQAAPRKLEEPPSGPLYWAWIVGMFVVTAIALVALYPWVRSAQQRWANRKTEADFRAAESKRLEGHRLDPQEGDKK